MNSYSDYIDRGAAIQALTERIKNIGRENDCDILSLRQVIRDIPAADVRPVVHAKQMLENTPDEYWGDWGTCTACGESTIYGYNFCPNCGAKMEANNETD